MSTCTELDRKLVDNGHPFTPSELIEFTQQLQDLLMQEGFVVTPTAPYPSRVHQNIYVKLVPNTTCTYGDLRITITCSAGVSSSTRGGWVDTYSHPDVPRIVAGVMGDTAPITGLLASMHRVRQGIEVVTACSNCHYYYSNPGYADYFLESSYCGIGRPLQKDCIDYTKGVPHTHNH